MNIPQAIIDFILEQITHIKEIRKYVDILPRLQYFFENVLGWNMARSYYTTLIVGLIIVGGPILLFNKFKKR